MDSQKLTSVQRQILRYYMLFLSVFPVAYGLVIVFTIGLRDSAELILLLIGMTIPVLVISSIIFHLGLKKIAAIVQEKGIDAFAARFTKTPRNGMIGIAIATGMGTIIGIPIGIISGAFVSFGQGIFYLLIGLILAVIVSTLFYFFSKVSIYSLKDSIAITPITLFHKLMIPLFSGIMVIMIIASAGIYNLSYKQIHTTYSKEISSKINAFSRDIAAKLSITHKQLLALSHSREIQDGKPDQIRRLLQNVHASRDSLILYYFYADREGNLTSSDDKETAVNISDRDYFRTAIKSGTLTFSEPLVSKIDGNRIMIIAQPVMKNGAADGVLCATIMLKSIEDSLNSNIITATGRYIILQKNGTCFFHPDQDIIGKTIGKEIVDDGVNMKDIERMMTSASRTFFEYTYDKKPTLGYKTEIDLLGHWLVFSMEKSDFITPLNEMLLQISAAILALILILYFLINRIAKSFSVPIQNTIKVIQSLAQGDLTAESNDFLADEFGALIDNLRTFQKKLRETMCQVANAAAQLSSSATELAATSQSLSESAQLQAASVEEASASLEEISASVENINNSAKQQASLAKDTNQSMEELKNDNQTVVYYAEQALTTSRSLTEQANTGQKLMTSTISGMNSIAQSTQKIAETVRLISDISDQVNLLALNASIEAARAGEHGKGFAVVAEEISKLADQTAASAKTITELVTSGMKEVSQGRSYVDETGAALQNIIAFISKTEEIVGQITGSSEKQARSSGSVLVNTTSVMTMADAISASTHEQMITNQEMAKTVEQINQSTQSNAAAAEQIASSTEQISAQAEMLRAQIHFFKV